MSIVERLSTSVGDRTQGANLAVAETVKANTSLLAEIADGFDTASVKLLGDCVEIFTMVAVGQPEAVIPYLPAFQKLLHIRDKRVRWEAAHTLALTAIHAPDVIKKMVADLEELVARDESMIVRGYALQALGEYARSKPAAADSVFIFLRESLGLWQGEHAHLALEALGKAALANKDYASEVTEIASGYANHEKSRMKKAAKTVLKQLGEK
ncbi:MAG: HEAT repeat domain-containing protein [Terracidiphilus sp.]